ncbi:major facilitator superfamily domain-containing protein [Pestalotiopsis sp. NC0098]|nr:major facilitator superfamily domain-containing protein [Pestalotiopsis sp. NC0098]
MSKHDTDVASSVDFPVTIKEVRSRSFSNDDDEPFRPDAQLKLAFSALVVLTFMVAMNSTALAVAIPTIAADLNGSALETFWAGTGFLLTEAIFMAPLGRLSDVMGRVPVLNFSTGLFLAGTIVSSAAPTLTVLIFGRAIQGAGGGGIAVLLEIVVTDLVPLQVRGNYFSVISALWTLGDVAGPILGGLVASRASWRWIFWSNIPVAVIGLVLTNLFIQLHPVPGTYSEKFKQVDWIGMVVSVAAFTSLLIGITWGGVLYSWDSPSTIIPIVMGLVGIGLFVVCEKYAVSEPLIRFELLGGYNMIYALFAAFFHTVLVLGLIYVLPLYFEAVQRCESLQAALSMIPYGITLAPFSALAGLVISRTGNISWVLRAGWALAILGSGLLVLLDAETAAWRSALIIACCGAGLGLLYNSLILLAQASLAECHAAFAVTVLNHVRYLGQAMGVAVVGVVFQNRMGAAMRADPELAASAAEYASDAAALIQKLKVLPEGPFKDKVIDAYADALRTIWIAMCALCVLPFLGSFFLSRLDMGRSHRATQGPRDDDKCGSDDCSRFDV